MLRSEANLVAAVGAPLEHVRSRDRPRHSRPHRRRGRSAYVREVRALLRGDRMALAREASEKFDARALFGTPSEGPLTFLCAKARVAALADWLVSRGAEHVAVSTLDYVFGARNALYDKLCARIG